MLARSERADVDAGGVSVKDRDDDGGVGRLGESAFIHRQGINGVDPVGPGQQPTGASIDAAIDSPAAEPGHGWQGLDGQGPIGLRTHGIAGGSPQFGHSRRLAAVDVLEQHGGCRDDGEGAHLSRVGGWSACRGSSILPSPGRGSVHRSSRPVPGRRRHRAGRRTENPGRRGGSRASPR